MRAVIAFGDDDDRVDIQYVGEPFSVSSRSYTLLPEAITEDKTVLYIESFHEVFYPVMRGNELRLELSETDSRKVDVPTLSMLTYRRPAP